MNKKPERILPAWRCPDHQEAVYTAPGACEAPSCGKKLQKFTPITDLPTIFRCKSCKGTFTEEPSDKQGHLWVCPNCGNPTITAYGCDEAYLLKLKGRAEHPDFQFERTIKQTFQITNAISRAAFKAQTLAERLSHRRPKDSDDQGYIDGVEFDIARFNMRAQMVVDMVMVKSLLEEAELTSYVGGALQRILDARIGPRLESLMKKRVPSETPRQ